MADQKSVPLPARSGAIAAVLDGVLLPELTRVICDYQRRAGHRFDATTMTAPDEKMRVASDGRSFAVVHERGVYDAREYHVYARDMLDTGAHRWAIRIPSDMPCRIELGDVRTSGPDTVTLGNWTDSAVWSLCDMRADLTATRKPVSYRAALRRWSDAYKSKATVVQCTYDEGAATVRMEIVDEPEAGAVTFTERSRSAAAEEAPQTELSGLNRLPIGC